LVKQSESDYPAVSEMNIPDEGCVVHLRGYGQIKLFRIEHLAQEPEFWATDVLSMNPERRIELRKISWKIEEFHRGVKQFCGIERCQARKSQSQMSHILLSIRSFLVFERARLTKGMSWYEFKNEYSPFLCCAVYRESIPLLILCGYPWNSLSIIRLRNSYLVQTTTSMESLLDFTSQERYKRVSELGDKVAESDT